MRQPAWRAVVIAALTLPAAWPRAELSGDDYAGSVAAPLSAAERDRLAAELEAARRREAGAAAAREAAAREAVAREAARRAQRPPGERLTDARCTGCHTLAVLGSQRAGVVGWRWTVERMRWWHGAPLAPGDAALIAGHLASRYPGTPVRHALEWGTLLAMAAALPMAAAVHASRRRRRRREEHP